jgi:peroxisomal 3,2-trans-enoyl-CoA isomerase
MSSAITCEYKGRIAVITIDKDHKLNALDGDEYYLLARYMREIATHDEVFITVLTGKGTTLSPLRPFQSISNPWQDGISQRTHP